MEVNACRGCLVGHVKTTEAKLNDNSFTMAPSVAQADETLAGFGSAVRAESAVLA